MKDRNGKTITVGAKAVIIRGTSVLNGFGGTVRAMKTTLWGGDRVRVADGPEGDPHWSTWAKPDEVLLLGGEVERKGEDK
jgi:hypothetical protein